MVPGVYDAYLAAMATAAAALIGLLFVAVSVRDDTIFGPHAVPGGEALAITAFTGLVNSFVVSLLGLIPKVNIGEPAVIMAVIGIVAIVRLQRRLHTGRNLLVLVITLLAYAAQLGFGVLLLVDPHDSGQLLNLSFIVFVTLIVSLQRAWHDHPVRAKTRGISRRLPGGGRPLAVDGTSSGRSGCAWRDQPSPQRTHTICIRSARDRGFLDEQKTDAACQGWAVCGVARRCQRPR